LKNPIKTDLKVGIRRFSAWRSVSRGSASEINQASSLVVSLSKRCLGYRSK